MNEHIDPSAYASHDAHRAREQADENRRQLAALTQRIEALERIVAQLVNNSGAPADGRDQQ